MEETLDGVTVKQEEVIKTIRWSEDGALLVSIFEDSRIRIHNSEDEVNAAIYGETNTPIPVPLIAFEEFQKPVTILAFDLPPDFTTCKQILASQRGIPVQLLDLLNASVLLSYRLIDTRHDKLLDVTSVLYNLDSSDSFLAGATNKLAHFDISRTSPTSVVTIPKTGIINTIVDSLRTPATVYTGSHSNELCMLDINSPIPVVQRCNTLSGAGITQILESDNGRYLYVVSRRSNSISVMDPRMITEPVAFLENWNPVGPESDDQNQRFLVSTLPGQRGVIGGTSKGEIKHWRDSEFGISCSPEVIYQFSPKFGPVSTTLLRPNTIGEVATLTGSRYTELESVISLINLSSKI